MAHKIREPKKNYPSENEYHPNLGLIIVLIIGFSFFIIYMMGYIYIMYSILTHVRGSTPEILGYVIAITGLGFFIIEIISVILIANDASKLNVGSAYSKERFFQSKTWKIHGWAILVFFFWFFIFPLYVYRRKELYKINKQTLPINNCDFCNQPKRYIEEYNRWYCDFCEEYSMN